MSISEAMLIDPMVATFVEEIKAGKLRLCGCMGPVYGEPHCPCKMERLGLPSSPEHIAATKKANEDLEILFGHNGTYYNKE